MAKIKNKADIQLFELKKLIIRNLEDDPIQRWPEDELEELLADETVFNMKYYRDKLEDAKHRRRTRASLEDQYNALEREIEELQELITSRSKPAIDWVKGDRERYIKVTSISSSAYFLVEFGLLINHGDEDKAPTLINVAEASNADFDAALEGAFEAYKEKVL